jgi:hypothetical protein
MVFRDLDNFTSPAKLAAFIRHYTIRRPVTQCALQRLTLNPEWRVALPSCCHSNESDCDVNPDLTKKTSGPTAVGAKLRKLGLAISYFVSIVYVLSILLPSVYCLRQGCRGPAELDAFMPAFGLTPFGAIATAFSLHNAIQHIRKRQSWSWAFWPLAILFATVLLGVIAFIVWIIYETASHR